MKVRPKRYPTVIIATSASEMATTSCCCRTVAAAYASAVACSTMTVQPRSGIRAATPSSRLPASTYSCATGDAHRRHRHAFDGERRILRDCDARFADAARHHRGAALVEQRDLAEFAELQDVVLEDLILLRRGEPGVLEVGRERLQQLGVRQHVPTNFLGGANGDVAVAVDDRFASAALQRHNRDEAVDEERHDGREPEQQGEACRDASDGHGVNSAWRDRRPPRWASTVVSCSARRALPRRARRSAWTPPAREPSRRERSPAGRR